MNKIILTLAAVAPCLLFGATARADILFSNPAAGDLHDCSFNTVCASTDFAAQQFVLNESVIVGSASFTDQDGPTPGPAPTGVNWIILAADGAGGSPGTVLGSGSSSISSTTDLGPNTDNGTELNQYGFDIAPLNLSSGTYYLAIQALTTNFFNFLTQGSLASGAAETTDGGATWSFGYESIPSVAMTVEGEVPEPASLSLLAAGLLGLGTIRRRAD